MTPECGGCPPRPVHTAPDGVGTQQGDHHAASRPGSSLSVDPQVSQTLLPYEYANDDPVLDTDPTGQCPGAWWEGCFIANVRWTEEPGFYPRYPNDALYITPTGLARAALHAGGDPFTWFVNNLWFLKLAWGEVLGAAGRRANTGSQFSQFGCHWWVVRWRAPGNIFHIEPLREDFGTIAVTPRRRLFGTDCYRQCS